MINLSFALGSPRDVAIYGNQLILGAKIKQVLIPPSFFALAFHNDLEYRHVNACINSGNSLAISIKI